MLVKLSISKPQNLLIGDVIVRQKVRKALLNGENRKEDEEHDNGAENDHRDDTPLAVNDNGQVDHLIDGVKVGVVEIANEPENARANGLLDHEDKGDKVKDANHAH